MQALLLHSTQHHMWLMISYLIERTYFQPLHRSAPPGLTLVGLKTLIRGCAACRRELMNRHKELAVKAIVVSHGTCGTKTNEQNTPQVRLAEQRIS